MRLEMGKPEILFFGGGPCDQPIEIKSDKNEKTNFIKNQLTGEYDEVPKTARYYKEASNGSIVIGDENYGEGSSREHAAMEPRNLGVKAVIVRSFARIHETNLKKQGILALTFSNPDDYEKILEDDKISLLELNKLEPNKQVKCVLTHKDGGKDDILLNHSYNKAQIEWFKAGSALNVLRNRQSRFTQAN